MPDSSEQEHRKFSRRLSDRIVESLHKSFSTPFCHDCLERLSFAVLLLNKDLKLIYATQQLKNIKQRFDNELIFTPAFTVRDHAKTLLRLGFVAYWQMV